MKAYRLFWGLILMSVFGCKNLEPVNELHQKERVEIKYKTVYLPFQMNNNAMKLDSLKRENHLLRVEIDYLKIQLSKKETLKKIKGKTEKLLEKIKEIKTEINGNE